MQTELDKLISRVNKSKANIELLKGLSTKHKNNKERSSNAQLKFYVYGMNEGAGVCVDESIYFKAVNDSIAAERELMADDYKTLEAMELLASK